MIIPYVSLKHALKQTKMIERRLRASQTRALNQKTWLRECLRAPFAYLCIASPTTNTHDARTPASSGSTQPPSL